MKKVIVQDDYFSNSFKWMASGVCVLIGALAIWNSYNWVSAPMLILITIFFTTYSEIEIDLAKGIAKDSFFFFWIPTQEETKQFKSLIRIRYDKQRHSYTANSRARTAQVKFSEYVGTLEMDTGQLELIREVDYERFSERIKTLATDLNIPVEHNF